MASMIEKLLLRGRDHGQRGIEDHRRRGLLDLPLELLLNIVDFLNVSDTACLSLCNHDLHYKLGTTFWHSLRIGNGVDNRRQQFLLRLARDWTGYFFCFTCLNLHLSARVGPPGPLFQSPTLRTLPCVCREDYKEHAFILFAVDGYDTQYYLAFQHLQLAMERHRRGTRHGIALDALFVTEVHTRTDHAATALLSVEPRIVFNELYLRVQQWVLVDGYDLSCVASFRTLSICTHANRRMERNMSNLIQCKLQHFDRKQRCPTCHPLLRCRECAIEFQVDVKRFGDGRSALVVTKWLSLGRGETPLDPKWRRYLYRYYAHLEGKSPIEEAECERGIRGNFEQQEGKSQQMLTDENARILRYQSFRNTFQQLVSFWPYPPLPVNLGIWVRQYHPSPTAVEQVAALPSPATVSQVDTKRSLFPNLKNVIISLAKRCIP